MQLFLVFIVAVAITAATMPLLLRWAPALGLTDAPGPRKVHATPVPRVGGIAMALGVLAPTLQLPLKGPLLGLLAGQLVLLVFGVWDDKQTLGYRTKLFGQVLAALLTMYLGGVRIESLTLVDRLVLPQTISWILTFGFLIGTINAINLSDGLDGLAGGLGLLCCSAIALLALVSGNYLVVTLALIQAGAIVGFLRFNTHPATVFMGDCGSQMMGFNVGVLAIWSTQGEATAVSGALPLLLIGVPIIDTLSVMVRRIRQGRSPFSADRNHLHHRLLDLGFKHGDSVILIYVLQALMFIAAYLLRFESDVLIVATFVLTGAAALSALHIADRSGWRAVDPNGSRRLPARVMQQIRAALPLKRLQSIAMLSGCTTLLIYAGLVVATTPTITSDIGLLGLAMLLGVGLAAVLRKNPSAQWLDRVAAYVSVILIVYLDELNSSAHPSLHVWSWALLAMTGVAVLVRFWVVPERRFEITPLDVLVVFTAFVVPNLPGTAWLPERLATGVAKAVILLYLVEMLMNSESRRPAVRAAVAGTLLAIGLRTVIAAVA